MNSPAASTFLLRWKGAESGPFSIEEIRDLLTAGDISRLHQVQINGRWKLLDDFAGLDVETQQNRTADTDEPATFREGLATTFTVDEDDAPMFDLSPIKRTSGLAVASLIVAICGLIPYVNLISWIFALLCGHLALVQIDRNSSLSGRGLAIAALTVTYFLLLMGLTYIVLMISHGRSLF